MRCVKGNKYSELFYKYNIIACFCITLEDDSIGLCVQRYTDIGELPFRIISLVTV